MMWMRWWNLWPAKNYICILLCFYFLLSLFLLLLSLSLVHCLSGYLIGNQAKIIPRPSTSSSLGHELWPLEPRTFIMSQSRTDWASLCKSWMFDSRDVTRRSVVRWNCVARSHCETGGGMSLFMVKQNKWTENSSEQNHLLKLITSSISQLELEWAWAQARRLRLKSWASIFTHLA